MSATKSIPLTKGLIAVVDERDYELVSRYKWFALIGGHSRGSSLYYARRNARDLNGKRITVLMHNTIMGQKGIDHRDGDGLNNRRSNLRFASTKNNQRAFARKKQGASSQFRGVSWCKREQKWKARLRNAVGAEICAGTFGSEMEAALARDAAAVINGYSREALNFHR
jgi:hypothetical protein